MEFANKEYLFLLLLLIPYLIWYLMYRKKSEPTMRMSDTMAYRYAPRSWKVVLMPVQQILRIAVFVLVVLVLARPQTQNSWKNQTMEGIDIMLAMDVSTSMLAEDLKPNRMEAAKQVAAEFITGRPNDNIGLSKTKPSIGVDILLVDAEDWGTNDVEDSWALGTQYWAKHPHAQGYSPRFGILLDMVGASGARFSKEIISLQYAPEVVNEVWTMAQKSGFSNYFINDTGGAITDDHVQVNNAGIKCIDIIDMRMDSDTGFFDGWHTTSDTMQWIDASVLKAVGQTVANVIYSY